MEETEKNVTSKKNTSRKGGFIVVLIVGLLVIGVCLVSSMNKRKVEESFIDVVRDGTLSEYTETIGNVFETYFEEGEWSYWEEKTHHVEFNGNCEIDGKETSVVVWFEVDENQNDFAYKGGFVRSNPKWLEIDDVIDCAFTGTTITKENCKDAVLRYISSCVEIEDDDIARRPEEYVGKEILIEDGFGTSEGLTIGGNNPLLVEYEGNAYDLRLNEIGKILDDDYGIVVGEYLGDNKIRAELVIVYDDMWEDSYMDMFYSHSNHGNGNSAREQAVDKNSNTEIEESVEKSYDMYEYMFSEEEGKTPVDFFINAGMGYEMEPTGRGCEYYSTDIDAWFTSDADYVECYVSGDNSRDYGVKLYGLYIGLEENEVYSFFEVENQGDDSLILWTEDEAGYLEISFAYGKVSELHFYYSYE